MAENAESGSGQRRSRWRITVWGTAALMLLLPLFAMQVTAEVDWDVEDFVIFGAMLVGAVGTYELAATMTDNKAYRAAVGIALAAAFILVWMNLAVGIVGTEDNPANLMYGGVLATGIIGALMARFQSHGMARAMSATALAQALVAVIALIAGLGSVEPSWSGRILILTGFFTVLWLISAWLFRKAARKQTPKLL
jgi:MFS family permease